MQNHFYDTIERLFQEQGIPAGYREQLRGRIEHVLNYRPRIGLLGKTGAGKSTLCNALFGQDVSMVSNVVAGTRVPQEIYLEANRNRGMTLVDLPGVGESMDRDDEYRDLYARLLPEIDLVLWLIKADDRALAVDESFYRKLVRPHMEQGKPLIFVITQVEKMEPMREWDYTTRRPSPTIEKHIEQKRMLVAATFGVSLRNVVAVSAHEQYQLSTLMDTIIHELPAEKRITVLREAREEIVSESAREETRDGLWDYIWEGVKMVAPIVLPEAKKLFEKVFSWIGL